MMATRLLFAFAATASAFTIPAAPSPARIPTTKPLISAQKLRGGNGGGAEMSALTATVCPALGFVLSNALYYSPVPSLQESVKKGDLGSLNPLPSALVVISANAWLCYGLSCKNPWIAATNLPGSIVGIYQLVTMLPLMKGHPKLGQVQAVILGGGTLTMGLWAKLIFGGATAAARSYALGLYATAICIILFASPLSTIADVIKTRDASSILAPLTASQCANCLLWTVYGIFSAKDIFVWGPNGTGLILGLVQLALKVVFASKQEE